MAPLVPRMHLFEIDDQPWFPAMFRARVQAALTIAWTFKVPGLQKTSPARMVASLLSSNLGSSVRDYVFIDFCAGGGGPTPSIEKHLNQSLDSSSSAISRPSSSSSTGPKGPSYAAIVAEGPAVTNGTNGSSAPNGHSTTTSDQPVRFVLTDLHPHVEDWQKAASASPNLSYIPDSVDAANAPADLVGRYKRDGKKVFRLFNLAFHHFDDPLARAILKNTVETSDGFGIFELQERNFSSFLTCCAFGLGIMLVAPYYAWVWRSPMTLFFTYIVPILPFVLVFDGWMSALRTRTPDEVEVLLRTCGAGTPEEISKHWEVRSGKSMFLWPFGYLNWIIVLRKQGQCEGEGEGQKTTL
ncbi:hypothetical protein QBC46DRAFT_302907 [Diplogelasinospora grovesii]|uniref:Uncharacterized protein n=1 Tax=Diplogelasinospora grovesii TaxID=303347 RepID=A0AAN6S9Q7_9PEZI|nr:hypothetical protein QBC46DRAFT_302907 [Diplogelasinospora grovesii]